MKKQMSAMAVAAGFLASTAGLVHAQAAFPTRSGNYAASMVRAMDSCTPSGLTVIGAGVPTVGCLQANSVTDNSLTMKNARVVVSRRTGKVIVTGKGFPFGARVKVQLDLRVTRKGLTTKNPVATNQTVTFQDVTVICPTPPFQFLANARGGLAGRVALADCLGSNSGLVAPAATGQPPVANIEILGAVLLNADNGKVVARPGILR